MTTSRQQSDRLIHDLKNLLSVMVLAVDNLMRDKNHVAFHQPNLLTLAGLVQELIVRFDDLAQVVASGSDFGPKCSTSDDSKIIPIKGHIQRRPCSQLSGKFPRSTNAMAVGSRTRPRSIPEDRGHDNVSR